MARLRAAFIVAAFILFTLPLMPLQWLLLKLRSPAARTFPNWYHRRVAALFGIQIKVIGAPVTGVVYKLSPALTLKAGVHVQRGMCYIATSRTPVAGDTWLEYREIRAGVELEWQFLRNVTVGLDGGSVVNRRFDYYDRDYKIDGKTASYFGVSLRTQF